MTVGIPDSLKKHSRASVRRLRPSDSLRTPKLSITPRISEDRSNAEGVNIPLINASNVREEGSCPSRQEDVDKTQHYFLDQLPHHRRRWNKPWYAAVAMAAFAVDASSITSFPEKVATNGGLAFIFANLIAKFVIVLPFLYLEVIMGQYFQITLFGIWGICPLFKGISIGVFLTCFSIATIYPTFTTWAFFMMTEAAKSIVTGEASWDYCNNEWNTCHCAPGRLNKECPIEFNQTANSPELEYFIGTIIRMWKTKYSDPALIKDATENGNLSTSFGFHSEEGLGEFNYGLGVFLGVICLIFLAITWSGRRSTGLIYTFSATFPLVVLTLMICRGLTLEGAMGGIVKYFSPDFGRLLGAQVWRTATQTAFFSSGAGFGIHLTTASFNHLHHNAFRDALVCILIDAITGVMGCVVNFSFLGHYYWTKNTKVPDEYRYGGMAAVFPYSIFLQVMAGITAEGFFATLYYLMIIIFTLDTCAITLQNIIHSVHEEYLRKYPDQKTSEVIFMFGLVGFNFLMSLTLISRGGIWPVLYIVEYSYSFSFCIYPTLQCIAFPWVWGLENICNAVKTVNGERPSLYLRICWKFVCPTILCIFLVQYLTSLSWKPLTLFGITAPDTTIVFAIFLTFSSMVPFLVYSLIEIIKGSRKASGLTYLMLLLSPEYEHEEIKQDVWTAKRLHWKHYSFLLFPDEKFKEMATSTFKNICGKKNRISVEAQREIEGQHRHQGSHQHQHHHHLTHESINTSPSAWSLFEKVQRSSVNNTATNPIVGKPHEQIQIVVNDDDTAGNYSNSKKLDT